MGKNELKVHPSGPLCVLIRFLLVDHSLIFHVMIIAFQLTSALYGLVLQI